MSQHKYSGDNTPRKINFMQSLAVQWKNLESIILGESGKQKIFSQFNFGDNPPFSFTSRICLCSCNMYVNKHASAVTGVFTIFKCQTGQTAKINSSPTLCRVRILRC